MFWNCHDPPLVFFVWRTVYIFSTATILLILLGRVVARQGPAITGWSGWGQSSWILRPEVPVFFAAAFCCALAFLYSVNIPVSTTMANWHPWLSVIGLAMLGVGACGWFSVLMRTEVPGRFGPAGGFYLTLVVSGLVTFAVAQVWFAIDVLRSVLRWRNS